tara:strand:- start:413 stop:619 length:207 start_codon:yes stop_codon:yes gene_type:complete
LKTFQDTSSFSSKEKTFVTIGTFDGVHFGHQKILEKLVSEAKKAGKKSVLLTFSHIQEWFCKKILLSN